MTMIAIVRTVIAAIAALSATAVTAQAPTAQYVAVAAEAQHEANADHRQRGLARARQCMECADCRQPPRNRVRKRGSSTG